MRNILALFLFAMAMMVIATPIPVGAQPKPPSPPATKAELKALEARLMAEIKLLELKLGKKIDETRAEAKADTARLDGQIKELKIGQDKILTGLGQLQINVKDLATAQKTSDAATKTSLAKIEKHQEEDRKILLEAKANTEKALAEATAARVAAEKAAKSSEAARIAAEQSGKDSAAARAAAERAAMDAAAARAAAEKALNLMEERFRNAQTNNQVITINVQPTAQYVPQTVYVDRPVYYYYPAGNAYYSYYYGSWYNYYPYHYSYGYGYRWRWWC